MMEALLKELNSGSLPHNMILYTLGTLATSNPFAVVPYIKNILNIMLPLFDTVKKDTAKQAFSYGKNKQMNNSSHLTSYLFNSVRLVC